MQARTSYEKVSVLPSVRLSVKRVIYDKTKETYTQIFLSYERSFSLVLWEERLVGGDPFYLNFSVKLTPLERKRRFSVDISS